MDRFVLLPHDKYQRYIDREKTHARHGTDNTSAREDSKEEEKPRGVPKTIPPGIPPSDETAMKSPEVDADKVGLLTKSASTEGEADEPAQSWADAWQEQ